MATLVVTPKSSTANSYASVAEADAYFETGFFNATWTALSSSAKTNWLIEATRAIDRLRFNGRRTSTTQSLEFPRTNSRYYNRSFTAPFPDDPEFADANTVPRAVKDAQLEMLMYLKQNQDTTYGTLEYQDKQRIGLINEMVEILYTMSPYEREIQTVASANIVAVTALLHPWLRSVNSFRWKR